MSSIEEMKAIECVVVDTSEAWYLPSGLDTINGTLPPDVSKLPARPIYATVDHLTTLASCPEEGGVIFCNNKIGWMMAG